MGIQKSSFRCIEHWGRQMEEPSSMHDISSLPPPCLGVLSIWGNLTQWREHQDWEEADLKYRALKMVLSADDPNILYIEKHFSVNRDENVIDYVKNRVAAYEDSVLKYNEMVRMAAYKDSVANELRRESNSIKRTIKNYQ